jgi:glycosyltransferase involved in cell wall biosynthesis
MEESVRMPSPLVTIVTPSYNQGAFIRATIESVLSQDYENLEYLIVDGGSTDQTASVVKEYAGRLTFVSEPDRGQSHAINKGFRRARGEYLAWLNSDDLFLPGAVRHAVAELELRPRLGAVYGEGYLVDRAGDITRRFPCTEPFNLPKLARYSDYILQQTVFFRKSVFDQIGCLDEDLHYVMDWDILIRIAKRFELGYIPEYMGCLREYPEAKSFAGGAARIQEIRRIMIRHTGMRFAPGYIVYGLETYKQLWCDWIQARTPHLLDWPSRKLQQYLTVAANVVIELTHWNWERLSSRAVAARSTHPGKVQAQTD